MTALCANALTGKHLTLGFDEGIYLHGAERILSGQHLYRDFFALTGPGTFWFLGVWFKLFSKGLSVAHTLLSLEIGAIAACAYLITNKLAGRLAGITAASTFVALLMPFAHRLYINHRWDSACCVSIAVTLAVLGSKKPALVMAAGLFAGLAGLATPPVLLVGFAIAICFLFTRGLRGQTFWFISGVALPITLAALGLAMQGSLAPMLQSFAWVSRHYSHANSVPYGFSPAEPHAPEVSASLLRKLLVYFPATLPILACAAAAVPAFQRRRIELPIKLLLASGLALAASCYPRLATNNLLFAAPLITCLLLVAGAQLLKATAYRITLLALTAVSLIGIFLTVTGQSQTMAIDTQLGTVQCSPRDLRNVEFATSVINPGDTLFVFPYQPIWYSLTGGINPTRFDFLQPGMMTLDDETEELKELEANPPQWVIWHNLPPRTVLSIWPHSDPASMYFSRIEQFIRTHYSQVQPGDRSFRCAIAIFHLIR